MKDNDLLGQLQSALSYPKYGKFDRKNIQILTAKQRELLPNDPGGRRVLGVAGSGKTIVVVNKAVEAARENKKVLVVCFNIMMATLIKEAIYRLARIYGPNVHRNIEVAHYHRIFNTDAKHPNNLGDSLIEADSFYINRYMEEPVDVLLIDEGQDFKREWVENLQRLCAPDYHFMFFEDDRQDIYLHAQSRRKLVLPGVSGRPNLLNRTHRIPSEIAELANRLAEWANISNESGPIDIGQARPQRLFVSTKWFNGDCATGLEALLSDIEFMWNKGSFGAPADTAILVCTVEAGRQLYELLLKSPIAVQTNFERHEQYEELQRLFADDTTDRFVRELHAVRRGYKVEFRMRTDKLKISTIHSFKGWELDRILVFFDPNEHQTKVASSLLYTAITRTQNSLTVYNSYPPFFEFGQIAINERLAEEWQSPK
jgi:superfamily I DNA/RNA helicase